MFKFDFGGGVVNNILMRDDLFNVAAYFAEVEGFEGKLVSPWTNMDGEMIGVEVDCGETVTLTGGGICHRANYHYIRFTPYLRREYEDAVNLAIVAELSKVINRYTVCSSETGEILSTLFVGSKEDISALYKSMRRSGVYIPLFVDFPMLVSGRVYGLELREDGFYTVLGQHTLWNYLREAVNDVIYD